MIGPLTPRDDDPRDTYFVDVERPTPGHGFFHLIDATVPGGQIGLAETSAGLTRSAGTPCP